MTPGENVSRGVCVEFATDDDLDALAELLSDLFTQEEDFHPDRSKQRAGLRLILDTPEIGQLFVLRVNGRVAGMANALITVSTAEGKKVVLLEDVIVQPRFRGQGFGRLLMQAIEKWARERGFSRITLLTDPDNKSAQAFYKRAGFDFSAMQVLRKAIF